jgi:hypothetical protein
VVDIGDDYSAESTETQGRVQKSLLSAFNELDRLVRGRTFRMEQEEGTVCNDQKDKFVVIAIKFAQFQ